LNVEVPLFAGQGGTGSPIVRIRLPLDVITANGGGGTKDVGTLATTSTDGKVAVFVWKYHDDDLSRPDAAMKLNVEGFGRGATRKLVEWRVDKSHADAYTAWQGMKSPRSPTALQYEELARASVVHDEAERSVAIQVGRATGDVTVPR
jgi:xylan 1,4-beta-xylosidase